MLGKYTHTIYNSWNEWWGEKRKNPVWWVTLNTFSADGTCTIQIRKTRVQHNSMFILFALHLRVINSTSIHMYKQMDACHSAPFCFNIIIHLYQYASIALTHGPKTCSSSRIAQLHENKTCPCYIWFSSRLYTQIVFNFGWKCWKKIVRFSRSANCVDAEKRQKIFVYYVQNGKWRFFSLPNILTRLWSWW